MAFVFVIDSFSRFGNIVTVLFRRGLGVTPVTVGMLFALGLFTHRAPHGRRLESTRIAVEP